MDQEPLPVGYADLVENARHMMSDRTVTNRQLVGDVFVREALLPESVGMSTRNLTVPAASATLVSDIFHFTSRSPCPNNAG